MRKGDRVEFIGWYESGFTLKGTIKKVKEGHTGKSFLINCDMGGNYEIPERFILKKL